MENNNNPIRSADRIFAILETLAEHGAMRIIDLSELLGLHKSTVHRLLASLISMGYVTQDELTGQYRLTYKLVELSGQILRKTDILSLVRPHLEKLSASCDETIHFVKRSGTGVLYLEKLESQTVKTRSIRLTSQVGLTRPLYCSAVGKAILSELSSEEVRDIWQSSTIAKMTDNTITDYEAFTQELAVTRQRGYALDNEENELGIRCIAVPVSDYRDKAAYAISISSVLSRMPDDRLGQLAALLQTAAASISEVLGRSAD